MALPTTESKPAIGPPSAWVERFAPLVPHGQGPLLDLACGSGRQGRLFLAHGHRVVFADIDIRGVRDLVRVPDALVVRTDLERPGQWPIAPDAAAGVVVTNYLHRPTLPALPSILRRGGVLIYETFALGNARHGRPASPSFLLRAGELLALAQQAGLLVVGYEHGVVSSPRAAVVQRLCAVRPSGPAGDLSGDPEPAPLPRADVPGGLQHGRFETPRCR